MATGHAQQAIGKQATGHQPKARGGLMLVGLTGCGLFSTPLLAQTTTAAAAGQTLLPNLVPSWIWAALLALLLLLTVVIAAVCLILLRRDRDLRIQLETARRPPLPNSSPPIRSTSTPAPTLAPATESDKGHESFAYTVSHDLRAPIRVIEGFTKILKEDYGRVLDRIGNDHLDRVLGAAARMNNMIDSLLALSQLSSHPLARQPVNLSQLATYVTDDLRRQSPDREVKVNIAADMLAIGDPVLLRVVVENLLGNAWKYTSKTAQAEISFCRHATQAQAFTVGDNGAGFDMRFADRLFSAFQRLHSSNDFPGTGIGLASVQRIVRRHGGEIWAASEINQGAQFHFSLKLD